jgi:hypothetical protein
LVKISWGGEFFINVEEYPGKIFHPLNDFEVILVTGKEGPQKFGDYTKFVDPVGDLGEVMGKYISW